MTLALHVPGTIDSWLRHVDARWKLLTIALVCAVVALLHDLRAVLLAGGAALVLCLTARVRGRWLAGRLLPIALMFLAFFVWPVFFPRPSEEPGRLGPIAYSPRAAEWLLRVLGKTLTLLTLILTALETTPLHELGQAAAALGLPRRLVHLILLSQRYVFLVAEEFGRMRIALRVRGFRSRGDARTYRTVGHVAGTLLVRCHDRAERVYHAMACRGFDGRFRTLRSSHTRLADVAFLVSLALPAAALLAWDRGWLP